MDATNNPPVRRWIQSQLEPGFLLAYAISSYARVSLEAIFRGELLTPLIRTQKLRDEAFGRFWLQCTALPQGGEEEAPAAHAQSNGTQIEMSSDLIPPVLAHASGTVLDIGPGSGTQMPLLRSPAIQAIYGAEPCVGLHSELRSRAVGEGLGAKYYILPCSVVAEELLPELRKEGVVGPETTSVDQLGGKGVFDTIICVRVLCSVPDLEKTVSALYSLLKPGGKVLVTEHVVNPWQTAKGSVVARFMQALYSMLGWSWFVGDCSLTRDTGEVLRRVADVDGGWESFELERSFGGSPIPYISGALVKKGS